MRNPRIVCITAGVLLVVTLSCWAGGRRSAAESRRADSLVSDRPALITPLPYHGDGMVALLDNGALVVEVGREELGPGFEPTYTEAIAFYLDTRGLAVVNHEGAYFLDWNGTQIEARGLDAADVRVNTLDEPFHEIDRGTSRFAVLGLRGTLDLSFEPATGWNIAITDRENPELWFRHTVAIGDGAYSGGSTPQEGQEREPPQSSHCEVTCSGGSCSIDCTGKGCQAYCFQGDPRCACIVKPSGS